MTAKPTAAGRASTPTPISFETKRRVRLAEGQRRGFESAWNEYYDCYASTTYLEKPLIKLEDIGYHLYLKKNISRTDPTWELPSFRQQMRTLDLSQDKIQAIEARLGRAGLLVKESGRGRGPRGENVANDYVLYEPQELGDFLAAVEREELPGALNPKGVQKLAALRARLLNGDGATPGADKDRDTDQRETAAPAETTADPPREAGRRKGSHGTDRAAEQGRAAPAGGHTGDQEEASPQPARPVAKITTPPVAESGTPTVSPSRTPPVTTGGTDNRRTSTHETQQTEQQQPTRPATAGPGPTPLVVVADNQSALAQGLVERGITAHVAEQLATQAPAARIVQQMAVFDFLRREAPDDPRLGPGRLRRMIEEDWTPPPEFGKEAGRPEPGGAPPAARQDAGPSAAQAARQATLDAIGATAADQVLWDRLALEAPRLPPLFRGAIFHAPGGDAPAALIFPDREACARAQSAAYAAERQRIARRVGAHYRRPWVRVVCLAYEEVARLLEAPGGLDAPSGAEDGSCPPPRRGDG